MHRFFIALCATAILTGCTGNTRNINLDQRLAQGINLQLARHPAPQNQAAGSFEIPEKSDLKLISELGLGHVRIRVNPTELMAIGNLDEARVKQLRKVIDRIRSYDLTVILTTQPNSAFKATLQPSSSATSSFANFWRALAASLADIPTGALVFEPINEPETESAQDWQAVQELLVGAVRAGAPQHRIIVTGHRFSSIPELLELKPLPYSNLLYSFHFYDPHNFTHQGANWGWPMWQVFHDWPYPSSTELVTPLVYEHVREAREHLKHYGRQAWNKAKLGNELNRAVAWAQKYGVKLICTEFGAYRDGIQPQYRQAWLADVAALLEERDIGWSLWAYSGNFGLVSGEPGARELDVDSVKALGLKQP